MIWIILPILIGLGWKYNHYDFDRCFEMMSSAVIGFISGCFMWFFIGGIIGTYIPKEKIEEVQEICAFSDNSSTSVTTYLFSSHSDEKLIYRYIINTDKGKQINTLENPNVYIEEVNTQPKLVRYYTVFTNKIYNLIANDMIGDNYYKFYVPEGTVTNEYKVDLK